MGAAEIDIPMPGPAPIPEAVGRYRICGEIASGGMASVYLAISEGDSHPGALRAIKRVHPHLARQREFVEMFVDEARIASRIRHPHVCGVLEWGESEGTFFLAMELLSGEPLIALLRRTKSRPELLDDPRWHRVAARMVADACAGLHAAHEVRGDDGEPMHVVHRDVSPHNLFVTWDGATKVVDFGVASAKHRLHHTTTGTVKGKFAYMAPEQLQGAPVDRRADVWSLGVVLWELLAGRPLFRRTVETETIFAVLNETIPALERVRPGAPRALEEIARRAITSDLERRTPTADRMRAELEEWLAAQGGASAAEVAAMMEDVLPGVRETSKARVERALAGAAAITPVRHPEGTPPTGAKISGVQRRATRRPRRGLLALAVVLLVAGAASAGWLTRAATRSSIAPAATGAGLAPVPPAPSADHDPGAARSPAIPIAAAPPSAPHEAPPSAPHEAPPSAPREAPPSVPREAGARDTVPAPETTAAAADPVERSARPSGRDGRARAERAPTDDDDGSGSGELDVATPGGWAEVWMDGARLGHTPGRFHLPAGRHTLVIRPGGGGEERRASVRIVGGQLARLRVDLGR